MALALCGSEQGPAEHKVAQGASVVDEQERRVGGVWRWGGRGIGHGAHRRGGAWAP